MSPTSILYDLSWESPEAFAINEWNFASSQCVSMVIKYVETVSQNEVDFFTLNSDNASITIDTQSSTL